jgi:hypothetical protein
MTGLKIGRPLFTHQGCSLIVKKPMTETPPGQDIEGTSAPCAPQHLSRKQQIKNFLMETFRWIRQPTISFSEESLPQNYPDSCEVKAWKRRVKGHATWLDSPNMFNESGHIKSFYLMVVLGLFTQYPAIHDDDSEEMAPVRMSFANLRMLLDAIENFRIEV